MKVKTSITLSEEILRALDEVLEGRNRSAFIEAALRAYMQLLKKRDRDMRDLEILNEKSDRLNREAEDVLSYQVDL
ncbi:MAG: ribbon-helix-helix protein, CopG family [Deltaproteobacteria bacterium]|nr:ribbon-helix-helix protein, CopG family [Deltaproteobacteria bacterium]